MSRQLRILLADLCYSNQYTAHTRYTPLNIGFVGQYLKQKAGTDVDVTLYKNTASLYPDIAAKKPDVVGFSLYYWNTDLGREAARYVRALYGSDVTIVYGGPSIDTDPSEQRRLFAALPDADFLVVNEGEIGFWNIVERLLSNRSGLKQDPIDGVVFVEDGTLRAGRAVGLTLDLETLGSPYLSGLLDPFLTEEFQPLVQTSRFCPYTCAFCVSGKLRGKIRAFPIEQIKEDLSYIARAYAGRDYQTLFIADENFGILERDTDIARYVRECGERVGYPKSVFFYNDKRFTNTARTVVETLGEYNQLGLCLALQTENPETLKAINRRNVSETEIAAAIDWAKERNLSTTTELIFGLPYETRESFVDLLNRSVARGFDTVLCHNLFIMDGIELNRPGVREKYGIKTAFRLLGSNYGYVENQFVLEHEEVVVSSGSFSESDFLAVRGLNFMFYTIFALNFYKPVFQLLRSMGIDLATLIERFLSGDGGNEPSYRRFLDDFYAAAKGELFASREALVAHTMAQYEANGYRVVEPTRINVAFGARLIHQEKGWVRKILENLIRTEFSDSAALNGTMLQEAFDLSERERINLRTLEIPPPLAVSYDFSGWKRNKYESLPQRLDRARELTFAISDGAKNKIDSFRRHFGHEEDSSFFYQSMDFIR
ncbi:MAG: radical SAM protein [Rhodospirillales bacterium]|nr:radical SAM protein [Rhodospirillales bacterium]